ncbi:MAG: ABC transporter permease subunit [Cyanobacteriota bacterium]|nr:ABC transporter permease subunit [Cyanobacteriota bacterium]
MLRLHSAYVMLTPALLVVGILFGGGLALAIGQSVGLISLVADPQFTVAAYGQVLREPDFWRSLGVSLYLALLGTGLSVGLSVGLAIAMRGMAAWVSFALQLTLPIPHLVGVVGMLLLLSPSGWLARMALAGGWIGTDQDFPLLVNDPGYRGVLIHFLWKEIPFATLILLSVLHSIRPGYEMQARLLGATAWQSFWHVTLPLLRPGILSASVIIFGFILGSFEVPFLLGATHPPTLSVQIYRWFTDVDLQRRSEAMALAVILAIVSSGLVAVYLWLGDRWGSKS